MILILEIENRFFRLGDWWNIIKEIEIYFCIYENLVYDKGGIIKYEERMKCLVDDVKKIYYGVWFLFFNYMLSEY